jgi:teichuronic acid biosynthesis glycosyltransferase TuaG
MPTLRNPLFTVVMPAYNASPYIEAAMLSVIEQSLESWELIVVDDNSDDNTYELALRRSLSEPRILIARNHFMKGAVGSRRTALTMARGRYISFLDSDDIWFPDMLDRQRALFLRGAVLVHGDIQLIDKDGAHLCVLRTPRTVSKWMMYLSNFLPNSTVSFDSKALGILMPDYFPSRNDYAYWLKLFRFSKGLLSRSTCSVSCAYRVTGQGLSSAPLHVNVIRYISVVSTYGPGPLSLGLAPFYLSILLLKKVFRPLYNLICITL